MNYTVNKDWSARIGISTFAAPLGSIVSITQYDPVARMALVQFAPRLVDWIWEGQVAMHTDWTPPLTLKT
jgi:hypothetical protein